MPRSLNHTQLVNNGCSRYHLQDCSPRARCVSLRQVRPPLRRRRQGRRPRRRCPRPAEGASESRIMTAIVSGPSRGENGFAAGVRRGRGNRGRGDALGIDVARLSSCDRDPSSRAIASSSSSRRGTARRWARFFRPIAGPVGVCAAGERRASARAASTRPRSRGEVNPQTLFIGPVNPGISSGTRVASIARSPLVLEALRVRRGSHSAAGPGESASFFQKLRDVTLPEADR